MSTLINERATTPALPALPELPKRPSLLGPTLAAIVVGAVVLAATVTLPIDWKDLGSIPAKIAHYTALMFESPNWEKLPRALF
ncbi:MAG TPA: phosphonate ABC transporter, permease protein PhnE, partial [Glaciihabitans sp.]|nr:phosphonate ABC transporter, permease protein PhnE [Glaciihabitans sp.]